MSDIVEFSSNGKTASGYLALPESGKGPGVVVIRSGWPGPPYQARGRSAGQ
jgi:dienelactone hydrolase